MNLEELNTALYKKMFTEQEKYRAWLLSQTPEEILTHTYEYTIREDVLLCVENNDLFAKQAQALLKSPCPLGDVYKEWEKRDCSYMEEIRETIEARANHIIGEDSLKKKKKAHPAQER